jgi:hypothetical protein
MSKAHRKGQAGPVVRCDHAEQCPDPYCSGKQPHEKDAYNCRPRRCGMMKASVRCCRVPSVPSKPATTPRLRRGVAVASGRMLERDHETHSANG